GFRAWRGPTVVVARATVAAIPSARQAPLTKVVSPGPSSPETVTTSPIRSPRASRAATASVSAADAVIREKCCRIFRSRPRLVTPVASLGRSEQAELNRRLWSQRGKQRLRLLDRGAE